MEAVAESRLSQLYLVYIDRLAWIDCEMGGKWSHNAVQKFATWRSCFKTEHIVVAQSSFSFLSRCSVKFQVVQLYKSTYIVKASKYIGFILSEK